MTLAGSFFLLTWLHHLPSFEDYELFCHFLGSWNAQPRAYSYLPLIGLQYFVGAIITMSQTVLSASPHPIPSQMTLTLIPPRTLPYLPTLTHTSNTHPSHYLPHTTPHHTTPQPHHSYRSRPSHIDAPISAYISSQTFY